MPAPVFILYKDIVEDSITLSRRLKPIGLALLSPSGLPSFSCCETMRADTDIEETSFHIHVNDLFWLVINLRLL